MSDYDEMNLNDLFNENYSKNEIKFKQNINTSLNDLLAGFYSTYLLPLNHIYSEDEPEDRTKEDKCILSLSKFKELNMNKIKEDMLYYCSPVDILSKLETNNREYLFQESDSEFYKDLSIKTFLQRQNELTDLIINDKDKEEKIIKNQKLSDWEYSFKLRENQTNGKNIEDLKEINNLFITIQNLMKYFLKENKIDIVDILVDNLNAIISELKKIKLEIQNIGYEMYIHIENNLVLLIGLIQRCFAKNEDAMAKFIGLFIDITNYIKSNKLFFMMLQLLNKYKNISGKIKYEKNIEIINEESIDLKKMINSIEINNKINIKDMTDFIVSKGYPIKEKYKEIDDFGDFWMVNNLEELFLFSNIKTEKYIFVYKINIRKEDNITDNTYEIMNFDKIELSNSEDDLIFDINISIKNELIYICYLVNQKLNTAEGSPYKFEFSLFYKIYSTSLILLKEGSINLNGFECLNSYLFSSQKYLYVISDKNKIFILKKNYSMDNYQYNKYKINSKNIKDISINEYKFHNSFNLNNYIILEKKSCSENLLLAEFSKQNNKYILNIADINNTLKKEKYQQKNKYKISYNDNIFLIMSIEDDSICFSKPDFNVNNFILKGIQFLPFGNSSTNYIYTNNMSNCAYKNLLKEYSTFCNLYGNFDIINYNSEKILLSYPYSLCFNININNLSFIIEQLYSNNVDIETKMYYFIIAKQYICCQYNANCFNIEKINKLIVYMKQFILDINIHIKDNKKYANKILKEIIFISSYLNKQNVVNISDIKKIIKEHKEMSYKTKMLLFDLLLTQPQTQQNKELFDIIFEFDKSFLLDILDNKKADQNKNALFSSNYKLYKNIMNKTLVLIYNYYKEDKNEINLELFALTEKIVKNIEQICKVFQDNIHSEFCNLPIFFNSINFTLFYFILEKLITIDSFNKDISLFSLLYNALLTLDKLNINKDLEKSLDLNNLIEIKSSQVENEEINKTNIINFNSRQNIIFKTNLTDVIDLNIYMTIKLIKKGKEPMEISLNDAFDFIYYDVDGIEVTFNKINKICSQLILNIIPLKDDKEYLKNKNNDNYKIINLLQKTILYYFLFLFDDVDEQINDFVKEQSVKNFCKLYHTEFLQFINTNNIDIDMSLFDTKKDKKEKKEENENKDESKEEDDNENEDDNIIFKSDELIKDINELFDFSNEKKDEISIDKNNESIKLLLDKFISLFGKIDTKKGKNIFKHDDLSLKKISSYKDIDLSDSFFSKLIEHFNAHIAKKNRMLNSIKSNDSINKMILKIFQIIIKYYNYNTKLLDLMENIKNIATENENYKLLCNIYEECCQMKMVYNQEKSRFIDEKFEEQSQNYINETMAKLDFIYKIIIPSFDKNLKYDKSIVKNLINLIRNKNFSPKEIIKYSEIQNLNCSIKVIELLIINNLLINLKEEDNLKFILYVINDKYNKNDKANNYSLSMSLLDSIYGADFSQMEQVKNQFHLLIDLIIEYILNSDDYGKLSITTKISLYQSLLWKYKGRDFDILPKIINCFEDFKNYENSDKKNDIIFKLNHEKIYRINNYNVDTFNNMKFEIFKIIVSQIFMKIKEKLNDNDIKAMDNELNLTRNISNITNCKNITYLVMSYFTFIKKNNKYYHEFMLFFYKNIINSKKLIELISTSYSDVILKLFDIIFDSNYINNDNRNINTKLIMLKLLLQILENINDEDKTSNLIDCCIQYDKEFNMDNNGDFNPFEFLISKFNILLNNEENEYLKYYYFKIFLFCLDKIDLKKSNTDINKLLNVNLILSSNNYLDQIESKFYIKNNYEKKFEKIALFCHLETNKIIKSGNLLCFIDNDSLFNDYLENNDIVYFNYNDFTYNVEQRENSENIFVIMDESLDGKIDKIKNIVKKNINNITLINNKKNNSFYSNYLKNNSSYIYDNLITKLTENKLNYKGINYILKLIYNLLDYITKESAEKIINYIFKYINDENVIKNEKEWDFCSLEYFINEMNSFHNIFERSSLNILNENKNGNAKEKIIYTKNEEAPLLLSSLFNYIIKDRDIYIEYKSNNKIKKNFVNILKKINKIDESFKIVSDINNDNDNNPIKMNNLSFYKSHAINSISKITDNSLLLIKQLTPEQELIDILKENELKIKSIMVSEIDENANIKELNEFISKIKIPIYKAEKSFYDKIISFFIQGKGGEYIPSENNKKESELEIITIYKPLMLLNNNNKTFLNDDKKNDNNLQKDNYYLDGEDLNILFGDINDNNYEKINQNQRNEILAEYQKNIEKKYSEINFDFYKVYCLENIKLCYRLLYELLSRQNIMNNIKTTELNKNIDKILEIFDLLCKEYYYNVNKNFSVNNIETLLKKYLQSLSKENNFSQKWLQSFMRKYTKIDNKNDNLNCKDYDLLLFIFRDCNNAFLDEFFINICFNIISDIIEKSIIDISKNEEKDNKSKYAPVINVNNYIIKTNHQKVFRDEFISYFLFEIMNGIYDSIIKNKLNTKYFLKYFINNDFNDSIIKFCDEIIEIKKYLLKENNENLENDIKNIPKSKTLLVQFGLKYLDICFYLFFKEKKYNLIDYWIKSNNDLFLFYSSYKILSTEKYYEEMDYKELLAVIAYISDSIECFNEYNNKKEKNQKENKLFKMKMNSFNKYNLNNKDNNINYTKITSFSFDELNQSNKNNINFNKLAIFTYNKDTKSYSLQDIIDTSNSSDIKKHLINYNQLFNDDEIYLVPLNNISTSLYAFGNNFYHSLGIKGKLAKFYDKPSKCEGLPKNIWHIGYGNNYCLALSEEDNQIYACGCNKGGGFNSTPRSAFTRETRINYTEDNEQDNNKKYINFATGNCDSSLLLNENDELYGIGNNEMKIFGLNAKKLKYPTKLELKVYDRNNNQNNNEENKINDNKSLGKIRSFFIGYNNCYVINEEGLLFGLGNNSSFQISEEEIENYSQWKNIPLPNNCKKFVDCAVGENYLICLIEDMNGKNKIYAQGNNEFNQCGITSETLGEPVKTLTMCNSLKNLSFKKIYARNSQCAAITIEGELYVWGQANYNNNDEIYSNPTLVLFDKNNDLKKGKNNLEKEDNNINIINDDINQNNKIIVDEVAICRSHMLIIARKYENGVYVRKLFGYGDNSKGALGLPITSNKTELNKKIKEIPLFNEKNEKLIPIKLTIGDNRSYILCVNENELLQEINNSKTKDNEDYLINISNISIEKVEKNFIDFYNSKNLLIFINLFKTITNKALSEFIDTIDEIKNIQDNKEKNMIFDFSSFFDYIKKHKETKDLYRIFDISESTDKNINLNAEQELKSIFNYLNTKSRFITNDIFKYCSANEKSEYKSFLQKAIGNNISYLNSKRRLEKFNELLSKRTLKRGTDRRVEVDRFKANIFYDKFNEDPQNQVSDLEFNKTIFGQVYQSFGKTKGEDFLIQKGKRLFIVCLKNEYASDSGGPYHEVISGICSELQSDYLNMFIKTPNNKNEIGLLRDKYIPNPQATREINEKTYEFIGKIMASAITSGEVLDLNLHPVVWKALLGNEITFYEYENIDYTFFNLISNLEKELKDYKENKINNDFEEIYKLNFVIKNSNETDIELKPEGEKITVNLSNLEEYITLSKKMRTNEFITQIEYIKNGFNSVIPSSIFQVLNWRQLEEMVCGKNKLDVRDLKKHTRYEGFNENDEIMKWFWEWLEECNDHEQSLYLKFVSGRARLPKEKSFKYEHIIAKNNYNNNESLPHSATCFFTLKLPIYKDKETLKKKMKYSILNCDEIDGDH